MKLFFRTLFLIWIFSSISMAQQIESASREKIRETNSTIFDINKIKLPLDNSGQLGNLYPIGPITQTVTYDSIGFMHSSGFLLSGINNNALWSNGVLSAAIMNDYQPGLVNSDPNHSINELYIIRESDPPFGTSWNSWIDAVSLGARFYDGDNDGIYNPIDLNNNGVWDGNEDRPNLQGDLTTWCVYNDGVAKELRRLSGSPQGIEVKQTVFASAGESTHYENIIFIHYEIENTGTVSDKFDSVYFAAAADPDLGDYGDDLVGCDTLDNSGYVYNQGSDIEYGDDPPAFFIKQLQGPPVFIAGETFIDNNNDGKFTDGIDTPLDSAIIRYGKYLGESIIPGAKNLDPTTFLHYIKSHQTQGDFTTQLQLRNYLIGGMGKNGEPIDPCTWQFGNGSTLSNCSEINPKFMYSGDPVSNQGWINIAHIDQRMVLSTGPFELNVNEPVELIYAYIVGRGTDALNSITKAREISQFAETVYDNNFQDLPTGIDNDEKLVVNKFNLEQNYPNPFNPVTTIKFSVPANVKGEMPNVKLIVFDLLGRKVKTLVNEIKSSGTYEVQFDASALASGVYFYQLTTGKFNKTKKLILLK